MMLRPPRGKMLKMNKNAIILLISSFILTGCLGAGRMLPGNIIAETGDVLDFEIETAYRSGAVAAANPRTSERFAGRYTAIVDTTYSRSTSQVNVFGAAGSVTGTGFGTTAQRSSIGNASAFLRGDRGTTLNCTMQIEAGIRPTGIGTCQDQRGLRYKLQF